MSWISKKIKGRVARRGEKNARKAMQHLEDGLDSLNQQALNAEILEVDAMNLPHSTPVYRNADGELVKTNDPVKSAKKASVETGETLLAFAAAWLAGTLAGVIGFDVDPEIVMGILGFVLKFLSKFLRDSMKERLA